MGVPTGSTRDGVSVETRLRFAILFEIGSRVSTIISRGVVAISDEEIEEIIALAGDLGGVHGPDFASRLSAAIAADEIAEAVEAANKGARAPLNPGYRYLNDNEAFSGCILEESTLRVLHPGTGQVIGSMPSNPNRAHGPAPFRSNPAQRVAREADIPKMEGA